MKPVIFAFSTIEPFFPTCPTFQDVFFDIEKLSAKLWSKIKVNDVNVYTAALTFSDDFYGWTVTLTVSWNYLRIFIRTLPFSSVFRPSHIHSISLLLMDHQLLYTEIRSKRMLYTFVTLETVFHLTIQSSFTLDLRGKYASSNRIRIGLNIRSWKTILFINIGILYASLPS